MKITKSAFSTEYPVKMVLEKEQDNMSFMSSCKNSQDFLLTFSLLLLRPNRPYLLRFFFFNLRCFIVSLQRLFSVPWSVLALTFLPVFLILAFVFFSE